MTSSEFYMGFDGQYYHLFRGSLKRRPVYKAKQNSLGRWWFRPNRIPLFSFCKSEFCRQYPELPELKRGQIVRVKIDIITKETR